MLTTLKMPSPGGVSAGQTATFRLPIGNTYHELYLKASGLANSLADITEIRVYANAKVIHTYSGPRRDRLNKFDGRPAFGTGTSGTLIIPFTRYNLKNVNAELVSAVSTGADPTQANPNNVITEFRVEVDLASGAGNPALEMFAQQSAGRPKGAGAIIHTRKFSEVVTAAGEVDFSTLARGGVSTAQINRLFLIPSQNNVDSVKIERNQYVIFDRDETLNTLFQTQGVRVPETTGVKMFAIDFSEQGYGGESLNMTGIEDFRLKMGVSGAMNLDILVEYVGGVGQ